jgi:UDP-N-acetylglucosamine 2-epimerase (non-hydrolysing)/GDP/UDP-N,N'-diacetylbacillosamine 2-epimerase (hydrolysing)
LQRQKLFTCEELEAALGLKLDEQTIIVTYHPVTLSRDTTFEADPVFAALEQLPQQILFCYPNADAGSRILIERIQSFCAGRGRAHLFVNLPHLKYWSLLKCAVLMIGNSSSGIMETPSLALPTINVGLRQKGRERARNVLDAAADTRDILEKVQLALSQAFSEPLKGMTNPYGDGRAAERITQVLTNVPLGERLLLKRAVPINSRWQQSP